MSGRRIQVEVPEELLQGLAAAVAEVLAPHLDQLNPAQPWISGSQAAADYLGWPKARVDKHIREIPHRRHGNKLMFRPDELDAWLDEHYEGPPLDLRTRPSNRLSALASRSRRVPAAVNPA